MRISTWNLESARRLTSTRKAEFLKAMHAVNADVWVLTETWADLTPLPGYQPVTQSLAGKDLTGDRRWVAIWVKQGLSAERQVIHNQPDRMACCRIEQPGQQDIIVVGTVLPWSSDKLHRGAEGFSTALKAQAAEWERLRGTSDTSTLVVAGDFNQSIPYQRYYGSTKGAGALSKSLDHVELKCLTSGDDLLTEKPRIDHICISRSRLRSPVVLSVGTWTVPVIVNTPITDHAGVFVDLD